MEKQTKMSNNCWKAKARSRYNIINKLLGKTSIISEIEDTILYNAVNSLRSSK